ncbi:MAG: hypothetical protein ACKV2Q_11540 [Planctomycetaceae bacterium]
MANQDDLAVIADRIRQLAPATEMHNGKMLANVHRMTCEADQRGAFADVRLAPLRDYFDDRLERRPFGSASWNMFAALHWLAGNAAAIGVAYPTDLPSIAMKHWGLAFPKADCVRPHVHAFAKLIEAAERGGTDKPIAGSRMNVPNDLEKRLESLERQTNKPPKPPTKTERIRDQRIKFCCPKRRKKSPETWNEIYHDYNKKFPNDKTASPDTLLHSHDRNCLKCREQKP